MRTERQTLHRALDLQSGLLIDLNLLRPRGIRQNLVTHRTCYAISSNGLSLDTNTYIGANAIPRQDAHVDFMRSPLLEDLQ